MELKLWHIPTIAALLAVVLCSCSSVPDLPRAWVSSAFDYNRAGVPEMSDRVGGVVIEDDGSATVAEIPVVPEDLSCEMKNVTLISGQATWESNGNGSFLISTEQGDVSVVADTQGIASVNWEKVYVGPCGVETPSGMVVTFGFAPVEDVRPPLE